MIRRTDRPINEVTLGDVLVDLSHDITTALTQGIDGTTWTPVPPQDEDAYQHGIADGVRWLLGALMVGAKNPEEVPLMDEHLETLQGVMHHFGEPAVMQAHLALKEV